MSDTTELTQDLDHLLAALDGARTQANTPTAAPAGDAITVELARPARTTGVRSLREAPEIEAFRGELVDGLIRADTANQLLRLINEVVTRLLM